ncbi:unnamed protein product [Sphagnum balticum]
MKVQQWQRCRLQRCNNDGVATRNAAVAAARARSDGAVAALAVALLELAAMALLGFVATLCGAMQRCWSSQRWCWCSSPRCCATARWSSLRRCATLSELATALCSALKARCSAVQRCQSSLQRCATTLELAAALCSAAGVAALRRYAMYVVVRVAAPGDV